MATRSPTARRLRRLLVALVLALIIQYLVLPQLAGARNALGLLAEVQPLLLLAGAALEAAAVLSYTQLTRSVLPKPPPSLWILVRIQFSTQALTNVVPGGSAAGATLGYRLLTRVGVRGADAGFALASQGIGSALVLNVLLWTALVVSIPLAGFQPLYAAAAAVGAALFLVFGGIVALLTRGRERATNVVRSAARIIPFVEPDAAVSAVQRVAERVRALTSDRRLLGRAVGWAGANWLLRAASLWVFLAAYGHSARPDHLMIAFGLAYIIAALPVTPGGLGLVEAVLTSTLVGFGAPRGVAILGVVTYRLLNYWLPVPLGGASYLSLTLLEPATRSRKVEELRRVAEETLGVGGGAGDRDGDA